MAAKQEMLLFQVQTFSPDLKKMSLSFSCDFTLCNDIILNILGVICKVLAGHLGVLFS